MSLGDYLAGVALFVPTMAAALGAAWLILRRRFGYLAGPPRAIGFCALATGAVVFVHVLPAALGVLTRATPLITALLLFAAAWRVGPDPRAAELDPPLARHPSSATSVAIAVLALGALAVYELGRLRGLLGTPLTDIDMLGFHLPGVARWIQTGTVWQIDQFLPGFATAQYPNNGDFIILSTVLPWHDLAFARLPAVLFFALTGVGVYALALELGASRAAAAIFGAVALLAPPLSNFALEGLPDSITLAMLAFGTLFLIRHARSGRAGELALGGLALGLALGTKWFGLTACAVIFVVWLGARLLVMVHRRSLLRDTGLLLLAMAAGGGFWLVRNLVESGNPLYPKAVKLLGVQLFAGSQHDVVDRFGYRLVDYLGSPHILGRYIVPAFKNELGIASPVLVAGVVVCFAWSLSRFWRSRERPSQTAAVLATAIATVGIFVTYAITPGTAYGPKNMPVEAFATLRWLMPAVVIGCAVCAAATRVLGRAGIVLELAGLAAVADGIDLGPGVPTRTLVVIAFALVLLAAIARLGARHINGERRRARIPALAFAAIALVAFVVIARFDQRGYDRRSYASADPVFAWIDAHAPSGHRIGLTGSTGSTPGLPPVLPSFGPRLGNTVSYVGDTIVHSVELPSRQTAFVKELTRGGYTLLVIGLPYAGHTEQWVRNLGFAQLARSDRIALYAVPAHFG